MVQEKAANILINLQHDDPETFLKMFSKLGDTVAKISHASVIQKKWAAEMRQKITTTANDVLKTVKKAGLDADTAAEIKAKILGIV